jgi:hypothetical protein
MKIKLENKNKNENNLVLCEANENLCPVELKNKYLRPEDRSISQKSRCSNRNLNMNEEVFGIFDKKW